jgi:16S rRNA (adenine1518-N6/adenine1519-N6)-dimethyltransferase
MQRKTAKTPFAKKSFGQNFLVDKNYIDKIIAALKPQKNETIVEIGAGRGALTERLVESGADVTAIELEREMLAVLREKFRGAENFRLIEMDALKVDWSELIKSPPAKLVANLPYYISTAILQKLIERRELFSEMILMFQREVVERITAEVGNRERGFLTVLTEGFLDSEKLFDVPPDAFRPAPKVWSAIVRLKRKNGSGFGDENLFRELLSAGFAQKRKTLLNNLKNAPPGLGEKIGSADELLKNAGIGPTRRAESLTLAEWRQIFDRLILKDLS